MYFIYKHYATDPWLTANSYNFGWEVSVGGIRTLGLVRA